MIKIISIFSVLLIILITNFSCNQALVKTEKATASPKTSIQKNFGTLNPDAPKETLQFGQLAGEWECVSRDLVSSDKENPKWYSNKATWTWEYVLGGHAVFNNWWQEDTSPNPVTMEYFAAGLFIFNPKTNLWEIVVSNSRPHKLSPKFQAAYKNEELQMHDGTGKWLVTFFEIKEDSFQWKYEVPDENGKWSAISEISAKRKI